MNATELDPAEFTMTLAEAAEVLEITPGRMRQLVTPEETARITSIKRSKIRFVRPSDVEQLKSRPKHRWDRPGRGEQANSPGNTPEPLDA